MNDHVRRPGGEADFDYIIAPEPDNPALSVEVEGVDETGRPVKARVAQERPLTIFLNSQEVITAMTIGDHPDWLAVGYLRNQAMLRDDDEITAIDYEPDIHTIVVRTKRQTDYERKMKRKVQTSGCAQGTVFGDVMEKFEKIRLPDDAVLKTSWLHALARRINTTPSLYLKAGAIHGCVLCKEDRPLVYMEDVGRHNAVDKIAGWMFLNRVPAHDKIFYTTGRLTSEMVLKCAHMGIPILVSRSGFTAWGVELARKVNMTLIGRMRGRRFVALSGVHRIVYDAAPEEGPEEDERLVRKGARRERRGITPA